MTRKAMISRRQFLTAAFRGRDAAPSEAGEVPSLPRDLAPEELGEHTGSRWKDEPRSGPAFAAPETAPRIPNWDDGIDRVLEELEDLKGIEGF